MHHDPPLDHAADTTPLHFYWPAGMAAATAGPCKVTHSDVCPLAVSSPKARSRGRFAVAKGVWHWHVRGFVTTASCFEIYGLQTSPHAQHRYTGVWVTLPCQGPASHMNMHV